MVAFTTRMPAGIPGGFSRGVGQATVEPQLNNTSLPFARYGMFGKIASGKFVPLASGDAGTLAYGILMRPYPTRDSTDGLGVSTPIQAQRTVILDVLRRGYASVLLKDGTATKTGQVYVVTTAGGTNAVNDIVTSASPAGGGTGVAITGAFFTGPADASGNTEVAYNI